MANTFKIGSFTPKGKNLPTFEVYMDYTYTINYAANTTTVTPTKLYLKAITASSDYPNLGSATMQLEYSFVLGGTVQKNAVASSTFYLAVGTKTYTLASSGFTAVTLENNANGMPKGFKATYNHVLANYSGSSAWFGKSSDSTAPIPVGLSSGYIVTSAIPFEDFSVESYPYSITLPETGTVGDSVSISVKLPDASTTAVLKCEYEVVSSSSTYTDVIKTGFTAKSNSVTHSLSTRYMNFCKTKSSFVCHYYLYEGDTLKASSYMTVIIPDSYAPSLSVTCIDLKSYLSTYGGFIPGYSEMELGFSVSKSSLTYPPGNFTLLVNYAGITYTYDSASGGSWTVPSKTMSVTNDMIGESLIATLTDSRGLTRTVTSSPTILEYSPPYASLEITYCDSDGTANDEGAYIKLAYNGAASSLNSKNTITGEIYQSYVKEVTDSSGNTTATASNSRLYSVGASSGYKIIKNPLSQNTATTTYTYTYWYNLKDNFSSDQQTVQVLPPFHILNIGASGRSVAVGKKSSDDGKLEIAMPAIMDEYLLNAGPQLNQGAITSTSTGYIALARFDFTNISGQAKPIGFCVSVDDDRIYRFILNATKSSSNVMSIRSFFELDSYDETTNFWAYPTGKYVYIYGSKDSSAGVFAVHNLIYDQTDQSLVVTYPGTVTTTKGSTWKQAACWWYDASTASRGLLNSTDKSKLNAQSSNGVTPWKMVAEGTSASGYTEYPTVDLSEFSEFLLTCNASSGYRVYASITITKEYYTGSYGKDSDKTQGMHVAFYDTNYYVGVSFIDKENVKLYFGPKQVYAALYAR